jgi:hypothetical protein
MGNAEALAPPGVQETVGTRLAVWLGPMGVAVFPVLLLYAGNASELALRELPLPLLLAALAGPGLAWALGLALRDRRLGSLAASAFLALFFATAPVIGVVSSSLHFTLRNRVVLPGALLVWAAAVLLLRRTSPASRGQLVSSVAVVAALLVAWNAFGVAVAERHKPAPAPRAAPRPTHPAQRNGRTPDIFVLVLDEYASLPTIHEQWGYDNEPFAAYLESNGFHVARQAKARYNETLFSITSMLNLDYVGAPISHQGFWELMRTKQVESKYHDVASLYPMLKSSVFASELAARGYTIVTLNTYKALNRSYPGWVQGDLELAQPEPPRLVSTDSFLWFVTKQTMLMPLAYHLEEHVFGLYERHRRVILRAFSDLERTPAIPGPKLVYAHILCPHTPFIFAADGSPLPFEAALNWRDRRYYLGQYRFVTSRVQEIVAHLLEAEGNDTVIVLVSDHGPRPYTSRYVEENLRVGEELPVDDMFKVLNALHAPRVPPSELGPDLAPVNDLRLILRYYFDEPYQPVANE